MHVSGDTLPANAVDPMAVSSRPTTGRNVVAVTGATGHLGNVLVRELLTRGVRVRALIPPGEDTTPLAGMDVEMFTADVRDLGSLVLALQGVDIVYHLGGIVTISAGMRRLLWAVNVEGTKNVAGACLQQRVRRLIYTSSVHAFVEPPHGECITEDTPIDPERVLGDYAASKAAATLALREQWKRGLDLVVCYPSGIIGPYDYRPSEMGRLILEVAGGGLKAYVDGAYNFVDVRDVAAGLLAAADHGLSGEGYIMAGHIVPVYDFLELAAKMTGVTPPRTRIPPRLARTVGFLSPYYYRVVGQQPLFTSYSMDVLRSNCEMSHNKAERELGFRSRPLHNTVEDTIRWFRRTGRIPVNAKRRGASAANK